jgi:hypothetical protein
VTRTVIWTLPARIEYLEHINYIASDKLKAAERVVQRLDRAAEQLGFSRRVALAEWRARGKRW